jgi:hypothetical protein
MEWWTCFPHTKSRSTGELMRITIPEERISWMKRLLVFLTVISLVAPTAEAVLLDFENLPPFGEEFPSYSEAGVTITAVGGGNLMAQPSQNGTWGIMGWPMPFPELRADFDVPSLLIKVELGDAGGDSDLAFLEVFNEHDVSLAYTDFLHRQP